MEFRLQIAQCRTRVSRRGFSFTEILFAVMILGIGFIMIAAMFPVAIHQTEANNQETIGAAVGRGSYNYMSELAGMPLPPATIQYYPANASNQTPSILLPTFSNPSAPTQPLPLPASYTLPPYQSAIVIPGQVWTMCDPRDAWTYAYTNAGVKFPTAHNMLLWQSIAKNIIQADDMRFAWPVMYRRDMIVRSSTTGASGAAGTSAAPAAFAQVIMIGAQCRTSQAYSPTVDIPGLPRTSTYPSGIPCALLPTLIGDCATQKGVQISRSAAGTSYIDFSASGVPTVAVEGAYVVISDDNVPALSTVPTGYPLTGAYVHGMLNGRIYRLGIQSSAAVWTLLPGSDVTPDDLSTMSSMSSIATTGLQFNVLMVGKGIDHGSNTITGPAQDVSAYTTYVPISN